MVESERKILYYKDYFISFYLSEEAGAQKEMDCVLEILEFQERIPNPLNEEKPKETGRWTPDCRRPGARMC